MIEVLSSYSLSENLKNQMAFYYSLVGFFPIFDTSTKSLSLLEEIFNMNVTNEFVSICEDIARQNPHVINNGIGVNFSGNEIESIKLYYGFHHQLTDQNINDLHLTGNGKTFFTLQKQLIASDYDLHPYIPTGVSFALKIDKHLNYSIGHFLMPKLEAGDLFYRLPKVLEYYKTNDKFPAFHRKGIFTIINQDQSEHQKDYYYVDNEKLKDMIGHDFKIDLSIVPSIEWVIGKGFYTNSQSTDEKIVLQSNYKQVYDQIISNEPSPFIKKFNQYMLQKFDAYCVCPGYYKNKEIKSYYYFNGKLTSPTVIDTISNIRSHIS
jgi:hypothetical protein